jgi:lipid-A-disaccharide synthase-like uncharacterized protein
MIEDLRTYWIFGLGFLAQSLFGMRILVQWWIAERKKQVVSPSLFWKFSLAGSALFLIYGILRVDIVIILGQILAYFIYIRNLQLKQDWNKFSTPIQIVVMAIPAFSLAWALGMIHKIDLGHALWQNSSTFLFFGIAGQLLLNIRFLHQLYYSERYKESILPIGFWWISLAGSVLVISYSIYRCDPVLLVAQGLAIIPYIRNIVLSNNTV